ncbi:MAG: efflux RND transporter periplasmic adaptor subunit [Raineya sp.]|jgi:RND family efflux transporter MFP subunit|nr:efflux RND transporter periplasmic adaptor subunit [Raineya sp.]
MKPILFFTLLVFLVSACGGSKDKKAELDQLKSQKKEIEAKIALLEKELGTNTKLMKSKNVMVTSLQTGSFSNYVEIQGRFESDRIVNVGAQVPGVVQAVYVRRGDFVGAGQVVAVIDGSLILKNMAPLKTQIELAKTVYEKQKSLWEQKVGTEIAYLQAKTTVDGLEQQMAALQEQYAKTRVVALMGGTVEEVYMKVGEMASPGMPGIKIVNASDLRAVADVPESYSAQIKNGAEVIVNLPDLKKDVKGKIAFTAQTINPLNRSFRVEVVIPYDKDIRPNMIATLKVENYQKDASITVPINVVQNSPDGSFVMVAVEENGKKVAKKRKIQVGQIYNRSAEILGGLQNGDKVITVGYQDLNDGDLISYKL